MWFLSIFILICYKDNAASAWIWEIINLVLLLPGPRGKRNKINKIYCC